MSPSRSTLRNFLLAGWLALLASQAPAATWWNKDWPIRKKITVDPSAEGAAISEPIGAATVLLRLHEGNFAFGSAKEDGSDIRLVAEDDKTLLPFHVEKIDPLLNEAFVWVRVPEVKPGAPLRFWLYYGNPNAAAAGDPKASYDAETVAVFHFAEHGTAPGDATANANDAPAAGVAADGTIIGTGLRLDGRTFVKLPASLKWNAGAPLTWSAWVKLATLPPRGVLFSRREGANAFVIGADNGVPFVEITTADGTQRTPAGEPLVAGVWRHLAVVASGEKTTLFLDGEAYATLDAALPALNSEATLGGEAAEGSAENATRPAALTGELDELQIANVARPASALKFAAVSQGTSDQAAKLVAIGADEESGHAGEGELAKHLSLITDISKSLTFDGWVVITLCALLALVGGIVTLVKFFYLGKITRATNAFLQQWVSLSSDLSVLDHGDAQSVKSMGGKASSQTQKAMRPSPLYHLYQLGFAEIQHRVVNAREGFRGLSGRSMQSIKATLDGGLVREVQRLNSQLVFLTIGIAGGPYLGLLGTVIGVMITFAVIAKSGAVEVNSIAPGIAGALLATVAGLAVAIPALFAYSYINTRIKDAVSEMQIFIDEFVAKIAEAYPEAD
ncbi:MAG: biopolymer transport protein ExbB [Chthoniobacter sp.]|jgi:biopolymer transport protein ExbB|nr:biopolymer transport protein ExbB [Chthoniobacter sp.]